MTHRQVLGIAGPIILSNLSVPLVGLVDTAVMGRLPEPIYIGAVTLGATIFTFLYWSFGFLRMGTTGMVAHRYGRNDAPGVRELLLQSALIAIGLGVLLISLQVPIASIAVKLMPASPRTEALMIDYYAIRIWSAPAALMNYVLVGVFIGLQRTAAALTVQLCLNLTNVVLDCVFVLGFGFGVEGVAWATLISEYTAIVCGLLILRRQLVSIPAHWPSLKVFEWSRIRSLLQLNTNIFIRTLCVIFAFAWFTTRSATFGDVTLAANSILLHLLHVLAYGLDGFAHAAETLVGSALGMRNHERYRWAIRTTTLWALGTALTYCVLYLVMGTTFIGWLTTIDSVRQEATQFLPWLIVMPLLGVWSYQLDGIFIGALRGKEMRNAMLLSVTVFIGISSMAMHYFGNQGLWASLALFLVLRAVTLGAYLPRLAPRTA